MTSNYVYTYTVDSKVIYVGIGTEDGEKFLRAKDIANHKYVREQDYENIEISIVARKLKRKAARLIEAILIGQHRATVLNKTSTAKLQQFCDLKIQRSGQVIDNKRKTQETEFWQEYREIEAEDTFFDEDEILRYLISRWGFVPSKLKRSYDLQEVLEEDSANIKAARYETQNLHYDAQIPTDDPGLTAQQRIADYLNYYAYGAYKIERVVQLAKCKSMKDFCSYMWHYFVRGQLESNLTQKDTKLKEWFLGQRNKRPKMPKTHSQVWRFERLYHFILLSEQGFVPK